MRNADSEEVVEARVPGFPETGNCLLHKGRMSRLWNERLNLIVGQERDRREEQSSSSRRREWRSDVCWKFSRFHNIGFMRAITGNIY